MWEIGIGLHLSYDKRLRGVGSSKKSRISSEKPPFRAKCRWFQAKYQKFPQDVEVDLIICGKETVFCGIISYVYLHCSEQKAVLFGIKTDILTEISIDSAEMSKGN